MRTFLRFLPIIVVSTMVFSGCIVNPKETKYVIVPDSTSASTNNDYYNPSTNNGSWVLAWSDEFNLADYSRPDSAKWNIEDRDGPSCGTSELEYLTTRSANSYIINGTLVMKAYKENYSDHSFTSSRLNTKGKATFHFGKVVARIQLPFGYGTWPAFWMMGTNLSLSNDYYWNYSYVTWPNNGEIDIMENRGSEPTISSGALHGPGYYSGSCKTANYTLSAGTFTNSFHYFEIIWTTNDAIKWYVDGSLFLTVTKTSITGTYGASAWPFDNPFFILLDFAIGGMFYGDPPPTISQITATFPQYMFIDWIRYYTN